MPSNGIDVKGRTETLAATVDNLATNTAEVFLPQPELMDANGQAEEFSWQVIPKTETAGSPVSYGVDYYEENEMNPGNALPEYSYEGSFAQQEQVWILFLGIGYVCCES